MLNPKESVVMKRDQSANTNRLDVDDINRMLWQRFGFFPGPVVDGFRRPVRQHAFIFHKV